METDNQPSYSSEERIYVSALPTERWVKLVLGKLGRGYELIIGERNAQLFQRGRGYEPCPMPVAKLLVKEGLVTVAGAHDRGLLYHLTGEAVQSWSYVPPAVSRDDDDDEVDLEVGAEAEIDVDDTEDAVADDDDDDAEEESEDEEGPYEEDDEF